MTLKSEFPVKSSKIPIFLEILSPEFKGVITQKGLIIYKFAMAILVTEI